MTPQGTVYLLHFMAPYKHARHYLGWAGDLTERLAEHAAGKGARLTQVVHNAGIDWVLARTWEGDRTRERQLHKRMGGSRLCPICKARKALEGLKHGEPGTKPAGN